jgi:hypothetical protein
MTKAKDNEGSRGLGVSSQPSTLFEQEKGTLTDMHRMQISVGFVLLLTGCGSGAYNLGTLDSRFADSNYCHRKLVPIGPSDPARPSQRNGGDYIDYSGPCDGPTEREMLHDQRRFEQFRYGRDYMDR